MQNNGSYRGLIGDLYRYKYKTFGYSKQAINIYSNTKGIDGGVYPIKIHQLPFNIWNSAGNHLVEYISIILAITGPEFLQKLTLRAFPQCLQCVGHCLMRFFAKSDPGLI